MGEDDHDLSKTKTTIANICLALFFCEHLLKSGNNWGLRKWASQVSKDACKDTCNDASKSTCKDAYEDAWNKREYKRM